MYLTPARYRVLGTGIDLSAKTDAELQAALDAAGLSVNTACNAPEGYSFLGGEVVAEEHLWNVGNVYQPASGRIWPYMRPLLDVSLLRINVTRTQYIDFGDVQVFINHDMGYVEPVAAPNTTALFTSVPPWLLTSPVAYVDYSYGFHFIAQDEQMAIQSGGSLRAGHQFWFTDEEVILKKNGVVVPSGNYTVDYFEGVITPSTPAAGPDVYRASYHYKCPPGIAAAEALIATDILAYSTIAAAGMIGLSGIKVEEIELRQSSKLNFGITPINPAARIYLGPYAAMFVSMR